MKQRQSKEEYITSLRNLVKEGMDRAQMIALSYSYTAVCKTINHTIEEAGGLDNISPNKAKEILTQIKEFCDMSLKRAKEISDMERDKIVDKLITPLPDDIQDVIRERTR